MMMINSMAHGNQNQKVETNKKCPGTTTDNVPRAS